MKAKKKTKKKSVKKSVKKKNAVIKRGDRCVRVDGGPFYLIAGDEKGPAPIYELLLVLRDIAYEQESDESAVIYDALETMIYELDDSLDQLKEQAGDAPD